MPQYRLMLLLAAIALLQVPVLDVFADDSLIAHWKLQSDTRDSVSDRAAVNHGVQFENGHAVFDGIDNWIEVPADDVPEIANGEFSVAAWIHTDEELDDVLGDVLTRYDPVARRGFTLSLMNYAGVTSAQSNWRNVLFGIDSGQVDSAWTDCGRPGTNMQVKSLVVFDGDLYAAVWEPDAGKTGHVYRYAGGTKWIDCGGPDKANALCGMAVYKGRLYAGSELYSGGGSSLPLSPNENHGGRVYRYEGGTRWTNVGKIEDVRSVSGLAVYKGQLFAGTGTTGAWRDTPRTRGMYRFDSPGKWTSCGCPNLRVVHLSVYNGHLFGLSYDAGAFFDMTAARAGRDSARSRKQHRSIPQPCTKDRFTQARGPPDPSTDTKVRRSGLTSAGWARRKRSWAWRSTMANCTPARCRSPKCTATTVQTTGFQLDESKPLLTCDTAAPGSLLSTTANCSVEPCHPAT